MTPDRESVCLQHSGFEKELRSLDIKMIERCEKIQVQFKMMDQAIEAVRSDLDRRLQELRKEFDLIADKFDLRIRAIGLESSEKHGERTWESHILTVIISIIVVILGHFFFGKM